MLRLVPEGLRYNEVKLQCLEAGPVEQRTILFYM